MASVTRISTIVLKFPQFNPKFFVKEIQKNVFYYMNFHFKNKFGPFLLFFPTVGYLQVKLVIIGYY